MKKRRKPLFLFGRIVFSVIQKTAALFDGTVGEQL